MILWSFEESWVATTIWYSRHVEWSVKFSKVLNGTLSTFYCQFGNIWSWETSLGWESCLCYTIVSMLWYYSYSVRSYDWLHEGYGEVLGCMDAFFSLYKSLPWFGCFPLSYLLFFLLPTVCHQHNGHHWQVGMSTFWLIGDGSGNLRSVLKGKHGWEVLLIRAHQNGVGNINFEYKKYLNWLPCKKKKIHK